VAGDGAKGPACRDLVVIVQRLARGARRAHRAPGLRAPRQLLWT
jgi:hypothetical protein